MAPGWMLTQRGCPVAHSLRTGQLGTPENEGEEGGDD
jgi:hypothetical protein